MTDDEILEIGKPFGLGAGMYAWDDADVVDFARAIAARERAECERVCESVSAHYGVSPEAVRDRCAAAIRARGEP